MEQWEKDMIEAKKKKELKEKYPELGKIVRRKGRSKWEYGVVVLDKFDDGNEEELFIRYDSVEESLEQLCGLPFEVDENYELKFINIDGSVK